MPIEKIKSGISVAVSSVSETMKNSLSFLSDLKDAGWEKVNTFINDILGLTPLIEVTGFTMKEVIADATIPPSIIFQFIKEKEADAQAIEDMLEQNKEKEMLTLIVRALQKADSLQKAMKLSHYKFSGLNMKIGLPPDISLKFSKIDNN
jgi:hypothetical protein